MEIAVGQTYQHFKGDIYKVLAIALHTETEESLVIYQALYGKHVVYARPYDMFAEIIDRKKYPNCTQKHRFELVSD